MALKCPYCGKEFAPDEILFYTDAQSPRFMYPIDAARDAANTISASGTNRRIATNLSGPRGSGRGLVGTRYAEHPEAQEEKEEETVLGVQCEDTTAKKFFSSYGEGRSFRFQRNVRFYGIKPEQDISAEDRGYGYVSKWEDSEHTIPLMLTVPSLEESRQKLTHRICPRCHCDIPTDYFTTPEVNKHIAALAGCTSAGKTQFITVALRELYESLPQLGLASMDWTECSRWFNTLDLEKYKSTDGFNAATNIDVAIFPRIITVTALGTGEKHFVTFYDCAGEYSRSSDYAASQRGFGIADTLLLIIDAKQLFRDHAKQLREGETPCLEDYTRALKTISDYELCPKVNRVITIVSKADSIIGPGLPIHGETGRGVHDGMLSYENDMSCHRDCVNIWSVRQIDTELNETFSKYNINNVVSNIQRAIPSIVNPRDINLMAVSTYVHRGEQLVCDVNEEQGHHRLIEPLLYAMVQWGIIPWKDEPFEFASYRSAGDHEHESEANSGKKRKWFQIFGGRR